MKRLLLSILLKHNGALAGLCVFFLVLGTSFYVMHGKFELATQCEAAQSESMLVSKPLSNQKLPQHSKSAAPVVCQALASRQTSTFNLFELFFSRS